MTCLSCCSSFTSIFWVSSTCRTSRPWCLRASSWLSMTRLSWTRWSRDSRGWGSTLSLFWQSCDYPLTTSTTRPYPPLGSTFIGPKTSSGQYLYPLIWSSSSSSKSPPACFSSASPILTPYHWISHSPNHNSSPVSPDWACYISCSRRWLSFYVTFTAIYTTMLTVTVPL